MINFKDRINKRPQQEQPTNGWAKQNTTLNKNGSKKDLFKTATNILTSQQFEPGDFKRSELAIQNPVIKKRNTSIPQMQCEQELHHQQVQQNYYNGGITQRISPSSMLNSNNADNYNSSLFQSKLHETKGELSEQIFDVEKRMKKQIQRDRQLMEDYVNRLFNKHYKKLKQEQNQNFNNIVTQLNHNLTTTSKKHKATESGLAEAQDKLALLQKQFSQYSSEIEQKMEKIMNSNANPDVAGSLKKSLSRNMANGEYMVQLKNSIKDIPVISNTLIQEIKQQMHDTQQSIKNMKIQIMTIKDDLKSKIMNSLAETQKQKQEYVQLSKLNYLADEISSLKTQIFGLETQQESINKYRQLRQVLQNVQNNYIEMNESITKAINIAIMPRIKKIQQQLQSQSLQIQIPMLKKQVIKQLESMPIIRVKTPSQEEKQKLERMKSLPKSQQQMYMLDENNQLLDCFGNYLLDENNQRIRLQEEQVYYLEQVEGIQIKMTC